MKCSEADIQMQSDITLGALLLHFHSADCTPSLCLDRLNEVVRAVSPDLLRQSDFQVFRMTDRRTLQTVACVVDTTDIPPELQLVQWSMLCPLSLAVDDPYILHGYVQQVGKQWIFCRWRCSDPFGRLRPCAGFAGVLDLGRVVHDCSAWPPWQRRPWSCTGHYCETTYGCL